MGLARITGRITMLCMTNTAHTKQSTPRYVLGTTQEGREYLFTGLGEYKSGLAALRVALVMPRNGVWYVFKERDVSRHGVVYGIEREIVATIPAP